MGGLLLYMCVVRWLTTFILFLALSTTVSAQNSGGSRERGGLGNSAASGLGRSADRALPLVEPNSRRYQSPNKLGDWDTRSNINPFVRQRR
jgi:hypothetical protein